MTTKVKILIESMKLFSVHGYDSVSVRTIAAAVGVRDSALYKHFKSKQAIFNAIVEESKEHFLKKYKEMRIHDCKLSDFSDLCLNMFAFQTEDEWIVMFRRMLIIEQYKNSQMAETYKNLFIDMPVQGQKTIFEQLIKEGVMKDKNAEVMAMELYAPFFLYHTITMDKEQLQKLFRVHVNNFIEMYYIK